LCYDHYFGVFVLWSPVPTFFLLRPLFTGFRQNFSKNWDFIEYLSRNDFCLKSYHPRPHDP
jgi:hypothetical protein